MQWCLIPLTPKPAMLLTMDDTVLLPVASYSGPLKQSVGVSGGPTSTTPLQQRFSPTGPAGRFLIRPPKPKHLSFNLSAQRENQRTVLFKQSQRLSPLGNKLNWFVPYLHPQNIACPPLKYPHRLWKRVPLRTLQCLPRGCVGPPWRQIDLLGSL